MGAGVVIAQLDVGLDRSDPALADHLHALRWWCEPGQERAQASSRSHGTTTARVLCHAAEGAAPRLCVAALPPGPLALPRMLAGLDWLLGFAPRVLLVGLALPGYNPILRGAIDCFVARGVVVIAPVGNDGVGSSRSPANYPGVISVGATDASQQVAPYSSSEVARGGRPSCPDLVARGTAESQSHRRGTSFAAARVAGLAARLIAARPDATRDEITAALRAGCRPLDPAWAHRWGRGSIDPERSLAEVQR